MNELVEKIKASFAAFQLDADKLVGGNKTAGVRARKESLNIDKLMKEFRKASIEASK